MRRERIVRSLLVFLWGVAALPYAGCGGGGDWGPLEEKRFAVDESQLDRAVTDSTLSLTMRFPVGFESLSAAAVGRIQEQARQERRPEDPFSFTPVIVFALNPGAQAVCNVARFDNAPSKGMNKAWADRLLQAIKEQISTQAPDARVSEEWFLLKGRPALAVRIDLPSVMAYRVVCQGTSPAPVRIDYVIPRVLEAEIWPGVESSLGTLRFF